MCFWGAKLFATLQKNAVPGLAFLHLITALVTWHHHACRTCFRWTSHSKRLQEQPVPYLRGFILAPLYQWKAIIPLDDYKDRLSGFYQKLWRWKIRSVQTPQPSLLQWQHLVFLPSPQISICFCGWSETSLDKNLNWFPLAREVAKDKISTTSRIYRGSSQLGTL